MVKPKTVRMTREDFSIAMLELSGWQMRPLPQLGWFEWVLEHTIEGVETPFCRCLWVDDDLSDGEYSVCAWQGEGAARTVALHHLTDPSRSLDLAWRLVSSQLPHPHELHLSLYGGSSVSVSVEDNHHRYVSVGSGDLAEAPLVICFALYRFLFECELEIEGCPHLA